MKELTLLRDDLDCSKGIGIECLPFRESPCSPNTLLPLKLDTVNKSPPINFSIFDLTLGQNLGWTEFAPDIKKVPFLDVEKLAGLI